LCRKFIGYQRYKRINQKIYAAREFLDTERSYLGGLNTLKNKFLEPLREIVDPAILRVIFCEKELGNIIVYNETLMKKLEDVNQNTNYFTPIGEIINQITPFFKIYTVYVNGYDAALSMVNEERERNTNFDKFLREIENEGILFQSFLVLPIQRPPRYVLLLKDLVKFTPVDHPDFEYLVKSLTTLEEVAFSINQKKAESDSQFQVKFVMSSLTGNDEETRKKNSDGRWGTMEEI